MIAPLLLFAAAGFAQEARLTVVGTPRSVTESDASAAEGVSSGLPLEERPTLRPADELETVPGLVITQHSGPGKANQYFLRGFNLDHGTDLAISVDGMPVNLPSHAHGQGYADLNFLLPELVQTVEYRKGPYYADAGDFAAAGQTRIEYASALPRPILELGFGSYGYDRAFLGGSTREGEGRLLYAADVEHEDGPWTRPDDYRKGVGVLKYSRGDSETGLSVTALAYKGAWNATDQVAQRAIDEGLISRWDTLDASDGGDSQRYSVSGEWREADDAGRTRLAAYAFYYDLDLFSDFTYFLQDPVHGDQIEQKDQRFTSGLQASREWDGRPAGRPTTTALGLQARDDEIANGLYHTEDRLRLSTTRADDIGETSVSPYVENRTRWTPKFRTVAGLRADCYRFDDRNLAGAASGSETSCLASPKVSLVFGPWAATEYYVNAGYGFHSNDARLVTGASPVTPLVRQRGAELGARTWVVRNLESSLAVWILDSDSELVFDADTGSDEPSRASRRCGIEWSNLYAPAPWLRLDLDAALSRAKFTQDDPAGDWVPEAIQSVVSAGAEAKRGPWTGEVRLRYFGPRPLIEDDSVESKPSTLVNAKLSRTFGRFWTVSLEVLNLFDASPDDIEYYYASRLPGEPAAGVSDIHLHPAEPRELRVAVSKSF